MPWLFSYSEISPSLMSISLDSNDRLLCVLPASLPDYKLVFKGWSRRWGGALVSIEKSPGSIVYGSAVLVAPEDIVLLRQSFLAYKKKAVRILLEATGDSVPALTHILISSSQESQPSEVYKNAILRHLRSFWKLEKEETYLSPVKEKENRQTSSPAEGPKPDNFSQTGREKTSSEVLVKASIPENTKIEDIPDELDSPPKKPRGRKPSGKKKSVKEAK